MCVYIYKLFTAWWITWEWLIWPMLSSVSYLNLNLSKEEKCWYKNESVLACTCSHRDLLHKLFDFLENLRGYHLHKEFYLRTLGELPGICEPLYVVRIFFRRGEQCFSREGSIDFLSDSQRHMWHKKIKNHCLKRNKRDCNSTGVKWLCSRK